MTTPSVLKCKLKAADGLHLSHAGYWVWIGELMAQASLLRLFAPVH